MGKYIKTIYPTKPFWDAENSFDTYTCENHNPWETVYITHINAHGSYPETIGGYYTDLKKAEESIEMQGYGGWIEQSTWGELTISRF